MWRKSDHVWRAAGCGRYYFHLRRPEYQYRYIEHEKYRRHEAGWKESGRTWTCNSARSGRSGSKCTAHEHSRFSDGRNSVFRDPWKYFRDQDPGIRQWYNKRRRCWCCRCSDRRESGWSSCICKGICRESKLCCCDYRGDWSGEWWKILLCDS